MSTRGQRLLFQDSVLEDIDDAFREIDELTERCNNGLSINNLALAKRYVEGELIIGFDIRVSRPKPEKYRAIFKGIDAFFRRQEHGAKSLLPPGIGVRGDHGHERRLMSGPYRNDQLVFIPDVELMELPKQGVPTLVWLEPADGPYSLLAGTLHMFGKAGLKNVEVRPNREVDAGYVGPRTLVQDQCAAEDIQARPEIMDCIADDCGPHFRDVFAHFQLPEIQAGLRIEVFDDQIRVAVPERDDFLFEVVDVFFGPFDLYPTASELLLNHG